MQALDYLVLSPLSSLLNENLCWGLLIKVSFKAAVKSTFSLIIGHALFRRYFCLLKPVMSLVYVHCALNEWHSSVLSTQIATIVTTMNMRRNFVITVQTFKQLKRMNPEGTPVR